ncbi:MAG: ABC transporter ATP-binding protein [Bacteroidetes bacterium]|nr:ABC transporter ATP-binding protein [Bacteroidota bacterium]
MKELLALNVYFKRYSHSMVLGILCVIISNIVGVFVPALVRDGLDEALFQSRISNSHDSFWLSHPAVLAALGFGILILLASALKGAFMYLMRQFIIVVSRHVEYDLKNDIYDHYQKLDLSFYRRNFTGDMMARIGEDVGNVRMYIGPAVMYFTNIIFTFAVVIYQMFTVNPHMTWYVLLPLPFLSLSIYKVSTMINSRTAIIQTQLSKLTTFAQETFAGIRVIKSFGAEKNFEHSFDHEGKDYRKKNLQLAFVNSLFFPLMFVLIGLSNLIVLYLGGLEAAKGTFTPGNIAEFVLYLNMLIWPVASLGWTTALVQKAAASQKRINEFLHTEPQAAQKDSPDFELEDSISFENVTFSYAKSKVPALEEVNFTLKKGEILGITGRTGSGKSTLVQLLMRLYDPQSGEIRVDGKSWRDFNLESFRHKTAYVPQDVFLFSESIAENIVFGDPDGKVNDFEIELAASRAGLVKDIADFPNGFETLLGERGVTLSGGQKQRLSIARALVRDAELYVLDDCLSAVDAATEMMIIRAFAEALKGKTAIIVSHRVAPLAVTDRILVFNKGRIIESGTRESLIAQGGEFASIYKKQAMESNPVD